MMGYAAFNFYVAYVINERNGGVITNNSSSDKYDNIVDTSGHDVPEDNNTPKIQ